MARFRVDCTFLLESRGLLVLAGEVLDGEIRAGMLVNGVMPVAGVEFVDSTQGSRVGLTLRVSSRAAGEALRGRFDDGAVVPVEPASGEGSSPIC